MYRRWLLTALALVTSLGAYTVMDCGSFTITLSLQGAEPVACHATLTDGALPGAGTAFWAWVSSFGLLAAVWVPQLTAGRRTAERAAAALTENLGRVFEETPEAGATGSPSAATAEPETGSPEVETEYEAVLGLVRKELSRLTELAVSGAMPPREWLALLVELNGLHNDGLVPTKSFQQLNTELLGLVSEPMARAEGQTATEQALAAV